jgi:CBS domain-containing protein
MKARDVMVSPVITVKPSSSVKEVAKIFVENRISAVPVVNDDGRIVGIVSESDLLHRAEAGTERRRSWWLNALTEDATLAAEFVKAHSRIVGDVMTRNVVTATPETPLHEIAALLEKKMINRVPIVANGDLVGIVSRANLIAAIASGRKELDVPVSDTAIRDKLLATLNGQRWAHTSLLNVTVTDGVVDLWGAVASAQEKQAIRVAAESIPGVRAINDNMAPSPVMEMV